MAGHGPPANSVCLPFYTNISDTPSQHKVDGDYQDPTKKAVTKQLKANLAQSDKVAKTLSGDKLTAYLTEQNQKNADYAQKKWQTMNNSLIIHSNKLASVTKSKLTFNK